MNDKKGRNNAENDHSNPEYINPAEGSLGLLAIGATGLKAWRKIRNEIQETRQKKQKKSEH